MNLRKNGLCFTQTILFSGHQAIYANSHYVSHSKLQSPLTIQWYVYDVYITLVDKNYQSLNVPICYLTGGRFEGGISLGAHPL